MSNVLKALARGGAAETDPNFKQTVLLLHGDGTNGAQNNTFLDSSTNNFTITRNGNTTQGTFSPFSAEPGKWSNFFDGTTDWLSVADNAAFTLGASDFTVECWLYSTSAGVRQFFAGQVDSGGNNSSASFFVQKSSANKLVGIVCSGSTSYTATSTNDIPLNAWTHIALVRDGNTLRQYINGVQDGTVSVTGVTINDSSQILSIGRAGNLAVDHWFGYISNFRQVVGTCLYLNGTTFTPPTTPLTAITNTSLLTCQSNRFVDNSTNAFAITRNGDVRVTPFSPFAPSAAYSAGTNGGSGYFDGTGDSLAVADNTALTLTGDFTIECFVYPFANNVTDSLIAKWTPSNQEYLLWIVSGTLQFYFRPFSDSAPLLSSSSIPINAWTHVSVTRSGNSFAMYVNGVSVATATNSGTFTDTSSPLDIGYLSGYAGYDFSGYISNIRLVKGTAITPPAGGPTSPLTAITNTSLLLNFTNAGIIDNTGKNVLETVGNAQIDTAVKKFGTGSLEFDGSGDWLRTPSSPDLDLGIGAATVECWLYITAAIQDFRVIVSDATNGFNYVTLRGGGTGGRVEVQVNNTGYQFDLNNSISQNTWAHLAVVRSGNTFTVYVNGNSLGTATSSAAWNLGNGGMFVGRWGGATAYEWPGYIDDLRITKGVARYTANFTAPTKEFPDL